MGDINLLCSVSEADIIEYCAVRHRKRSGRVRIERVVTGRTKTYHANIFGSQNVFTLVAYEGEGFARVRRHFADNSLASITNH